MEPSDNKRRHERYNTENEVHFCLPYDLNTKIDFQVQEDCKASQKYEGTTTNISAGGLRFISDLNLVEGNVLLMELHLPFVREAVQMEGQVRWSQKAPVEGSADTVYDTGVQLIKIEGRSVEDSIYFDKTYDVVWSDVLEKILGSYSQARRNQ